MGILWDLRVEKANKPLEEAGKDDLSKRDTHPERVLRLSIDHIRKAF